MTGNVLGFYCDFSILHEVWMSKSLQFLMLKLRAKKCVFFKCKKWLALIKNIWAIDKRKYYLSYYLPHWGQNKFKQLFFGGLQGVIYVLFRHIALFSCPTWTKIKILWRRRYCLEVPSLRKEVLKSNFMSCSGNYISLHYQIQLVAINIFRDVRGSSSKIASHSLKIFKIQCKSFKSLNHFMLLNWLMLCENIFIQQHRTKCFLVRKREYIRMSSLGTICLV